MIRLPSRVRVTAAALMIGVIAGACGGADQPSATSPVGEGPRFVQADVDFVVSLSQHHGQALHLAELASSRGRSADVKTMAAGIAAVYAPQVDTLAGWIREWVQAGAELPAHDAGFGETAPGMLPERAVTRLESLAGSAFDRQFRVLMARHHRGGLKLVAEQLNDGVNPDARALAERLRREQTEQLSQLN